MAFTDLDVAGQRLHLPQLISWNSNAQLSPAENEKAHTDNHCIKAQMAMNLVRAWQLPISGMFYAAGQRSPAVIALCLHQGGTT
ncbi:hypothetical protein D3C77_497730 [compost metagenome]